MIMPSLGEIQVLPIPSGEGGIALVTIAGGIGIFDGEEAAVACMIATLVAVIAGDVGELGMMSDGIEVTAYNQIDIPTRTQPSKPKETLDQNEILGIITFMASIPPPNKLITSAMQPAIASIDGKVISSSLI
jgi:hypothetical protein